MNPFLVVIRVPVEKLLIQSVAARAKVYERARETLIRELGRANPKLSAESTQVQRENLEQAIAEVEQQYSADQTPSMAKE